MRLQCIPWVGVLLLIGCSSGPKTTIYHEESSQLDSKYLLAPLLARGKITYNHVEFSQAFTEGDIIVPGQKIGKPQPWPAQLSKNHDAEIRAAIEEYDRKQYDNASSILRKLHESEKENLFYLLTLAKTLYWSEKYHQQSYDLFEQMREQLDRENSIAEDEILVDLWFPDLYWKLATFYLDMGYYDRAAFEISRSFACGYDETSKQFEQAISYLTECYFFLKDKELIRFC